MRDKRKSPYLRQWIRRLKHVENSSFSSEKLLKSRGEIWAFYAARSFCEDFGRPKFYVVAQVSLGEILSSSHAQAYAAINWMRCDIAVIGKHGTPLAVIEVQGDGHYGTSFEEGLAARIKDQIRREAFKKAKIPMIEIYGNNRSLIYEEVKARLFDLLGECGVGLLNCAA